MFNAYEFSFAGESSLMYGLMVYDIGGKKQSEVSFGNKASIVESRVNNRIQPIHFGVNYHKSPLQFKLVFGTDRALDRYDLESISMWLTGHQDYQWMTIDQPDLSHVQFRCMISTLTPISHGWLPVAFEADVICDCPYAYSFPFNVQYATASATNAVFRNESTVREYLKPELTIKLNSGVKSMKIINHSDNDRTFELNNLPAAGLTIHVDSNSGIIEDGNGEYNLYEYSNLNFFRLVPGDNNIEFNGGGTVTISGRFLHNVAG